MPIMHWSPGLIQLFLESFYLKNNTRGQNNLCSFNQKIRKKRRGNPLLTHLNATILFYFGLMIVEK